MNRRHFTLLSGLLLAGFGTPGTAGNRRAAFQRRCEELEHRLGGRLGASCIETGTGHRLGYRADERFPMCSTFKWLAAAAVLARVDAGQEQLGRRVSYGRDQLIEWSPVTERHAGQDGMTIAELCEAAITESDNTAGNLLLDSIGGTDGWNRYLRSIGDARTRLDRYEPLLNEARPDDERDTTTPAAMASNLHRVLLDDALSVSSRTQLAEWMLATKYSGRRLRSNLEQGWRLADKTGTGNSGTGTACDVGVYWPPAGAPIVLAVYLTQARLSGSDQDAAIADIGRWIRAQQG